MVEIASKWATIIATIISMISLWLAIRVNHDSKRPQIVVNLEYNSDDTTMFLLVQNTGNGAAYDINFSGYDESIFMNSLRSDVLDSFITKGIPILVPGAKRATIVASGEFGAELGDKSSNICVTYKELGYLRKRKQVKEAFVLDYTSFAGSLFVQSDMHLMRLTLAKIENNSKALIKAINKLKIK